MGSNEQLVSLRVVKQNPQNEIDNKKMLTPLPDRTKHRACATACRVFRPLYNCIASNFRQSMRVCISHKSTPARRKQFSQFYLCASVWKSGDAVNITRDAISLARSKRKSPHLSLEKSSCQDRRTMPRRTNIQYTHTHALSCEDMAGGQYTPPLDGARVHGRHRWWRWCMSRRNRSCWLFESLIHAPQTAHLSTLSSRTAALSSYLCVCSWRLPSANVPYSIITSLYTTRHTRSTCLL